MIDPMTGMESQDYLPDYYANPYQPQMMGEVSDPWGADPSPVGSPQAPSAAPPSAPAGGESMIHGTPSDAFIDALYPGYGVRNGQLTQIGDTRGHGFTDPAQAAAYVNRLWDPVARQDYQGFFTQLMQGIPPSPAMLKQFAPVLQAAGFKLNPNASGAYTDFTLPNGQIVDPIKAAGTGDPSQMQWQWLTGGGAANTVPTASAAALAGKLGPLTQPWTEPFTPPAWTTGQYTPVPVPDYPNFQAPAPFTGITEADVLADPSYGFRKNQGAATIENSGWAQGRGREGGFLKGLQDYGSMFAGTEFGNVYNRKASEYNTNYTNALNAYTTNRDTTLGEYNVKNTSNQELWNAQQQGQQTAYQQYLDREAAFRANQNGAFDKYFSTTQLGANVA